MDEPDTTWIFGYGSLIWRADFPYGEARPGFIRDWSRRFWQGSTDHRGVPGKPGRVVTLVHTPGETCHGMAYRLDPASREEVLEHLDYREKGGYDRLVVDIHFSGAPSVRGMTYHATDDNPNYLGEAQYEEIASQVIASRGPSGHNLEYVLRLDEALRAQGVIDAHVHEIAAVARDLSGQK
ncbi:MAG: gamma-glutamylcyclotransferase [Pseudomonadales bacterium]|nr:gamma-glutamylcyclotransferase [Pseudomonadales bacterium]